MIEINDTGVVPVILAVIEEREGSTYELERITDAWRNEWQGKMFS